MTEVYKYLNGILPDIMNDVLTVSNHVFNTRHYNFLGPKLTDMVKNQFQRELTRFGTYCPVK